MKILAFVSVFFSSNIRPLPFPGYERCNILHTNFSRLFEFQIIPLNNFMLFLTAPLTSLLSSLVYPSLADVTVVLSDLSAYGSRYNGSDNGPFNR